tara:strand:- start:1015 stop:2175 length:1161 start_codon:yes stop_codon:yes gene_type:complete
MKNKSNSLAANFISINSKSYPIDNDGGTCFTTYEIANAARLHGLNSIIVIPSFSTNKKINITDINLYKKNPINFLKFFIDNLLKKENIIYYNCGYNFHIIFSLLSLFYLKIFNKKIKARVLFSAHGSFDKNIVKGFYKKLWIRFIIRPFLFLTNADYIANSKGELESLVPSISELKNIRFKIALNKFPSFTFLNEIGLARRDKDNFKSNYSKFILYLGRIVPKKRLIETIDFLWSNKWFEYGGSMVIAHTNDDEDYLKKVKNKISKMNLDKQINLVGKVSGFEKWNLILNASGFVLLSSSEGLPMSLLEADKLGLPIIYSKGCNYIPTSRDSIFVEEFKDIHQKDLESLIKKEVSAYDRALLLDYNKLHNTEGFYSSYRGIFDEEY